MLGSDRCIFLVVVGDLPDWISVLNIHLITIELFDLNLDISLLHSKPDTSSIGNIMCTLAPIDLTIRSPIRFASHVDLWPHANLHHTSTSSMIVIL